MTNSPSDQIVEVMARVMYALCPYEDQETDLDGRPVGKPYTVDWDSDGLGDDIRGEWIASAQAALSALKQAGWRVVRASICRAFVSIEESQLGQEKWAIIIHRGQERSLWGRYATKTEADAQAHEALKYLEERGER